MKRLLSTFVVGLAGIQGISLVAESRPKLVVGIMVDQLRTDYLENLKDMLATGGFRRLMENGLYFKDVDFKVPGVDATTSSAIVQTGAYPRQNGITGERIYDPVKKTLQPVFTDETFIGNFTNETYSPAALRVTTLTDEITLADKGSGKIHSIAPDASQAIVLAGHTGNSAFWVNDETGRWSSTTYYPNPPAVLQNRNYNNPLISRLDTMKWTPLHKGEPYPDVSAQEIKDGFKYTFSRSDRDVFSNYKISPFINSDITSAATEYIKDLGLGKNNEAIDVLNIGYTLGVYPAIGDGDYRYELEDAYLRLDKDLEHLFTTLDKEVGKENVLVYLVSSGYFSEPETDIKSYRLPGGTFSVKRALSLLNAYLAAKYGNGVYVDQFAKGSIYLSKKDLEERNLNPEQIAEDARNFLVRMSGVADAFTMGDLASPAISKLENLRLASDPKTGGDILIEFAPGWTVVDDSRFPPEPQIKNISVYPAPGFILGPHIVPKVVESPVEATAIAPTIARTLHIRAPNSAFSKPVN